MYLVPERRRLKESDEMVSVGRETMYATRRRQTLPVETLGRERLLEIKRASVQRSARMPPAVTTGAISNRRQRRLYGSIDFDLLVIYASCDAAAAVIPTK